MKEKLLFVNAKKGRRLRQGFSLCVLELAKDHECRDGCADGLQQARNGDFEDVMAAATFAEAGDIETMRELMHGQEKEIKQAAGGKEKHFSERCMDAKYRFFI